MPTGEVRDFPTNTSDALMSGGTDAIAGAIERSQCRSREHTGLDPMLIMSGMVSRLGHDVIEWPAFVVENLFFEGLADAGLCDQRMKRDRSSLRASSPRRRSTPAASTTCVCPLRSGA